MSRFFLSLQNFQQFARFHTNIRKFHEVKIRPVSEKKWYTKKRIKNALEIPTFETNSHVLAIPAYLWLNTNHLRNFRSDGLSQD